MAGRKLEKNGDFAGEDFPTPDQLSEGEQSFADNMPLAPRLSDAQYERETRRQQELIADILDSEPNGGAGIFSEQVSPIKRVSLFEVVDDSYDLLVVDKLGEANFQIYAVSPDDVKYAHSLKPSYQLGRGEFAHFHAEKLLKLITQIGQGGWADGNDQDYAETTLALEELSQARA